MYVAVGSENPVKRVAVERTIDGRVEAVGVDSGVSEQPRGRRETVRGAENRARASLSATDAAFGVGIEGGVESREHPAGLWLIMWAAVTDGESVHFGAGPSIRLPEAVADRVRAGEELGPVLDDRLGREAVSEQEGAVGIYTDGRVTRTDALADAVAGAFGPFFTDGTA
ncbi:DUF84 family protein [Haloarcula marina]|uniref:DUF84 family protein n=1 Tax=Haloarcula marina TaxID=2961574 RepID=UPI0020B7E8F1|nr:inosine/xanthosine triphosphatase [Halomicroarcula marina]